MRIKNNVKSDGRSAGLVSDNLGLADFGPISLGGSFGEESSSGGDTSGELSSSAGDSGGGSDSGDGGDEAPKKRRGRPPGSGNAKSTKSTKSELSGAKLADVRRNFISTLAGGIGFGFSWYGISRGKKYQDHSPLLAQRVYSCYLLPKQECEGIAEPLADTFIAWFPQYVEPVAKGINPALAVARIISALQQTSDNEKRTVERFQQEINPRTAPPTNGNTPHDFAEDIPQENPVEEWMNQHDPSEELVIPNVPMAA